MVRNAKLTLLANAMLNGISYQTTHAIAWLNLQIGTPLRPGGFPQRGHWRILRIVSHNTVHDGSIHSASIHGIRIPFQSHEPDRTLRSIHALLRGRFGRRFCSWADHAFGCDQDVITNSRKRQRCRTQECFWFMGGSQDHPPARRIQRIFPRIEAQDYNDDA